MVASCATRLVLLLGLAIACISRVRIRGALALCWAVYRAADDAATVKITGAGRGVCVLYSTGEHGLTAEPRWYIVQIHEQSGPSRNTLVGVDVQSTGAAGAGGVQSSGPLSFSRVPICTRAGAGSFWSSEREPALVCFRVER